MSQPIFEWTFDGNIWPHQTFMGRRWVELWDGRVVKPSNGCLYFWGCIISTIFWIFRGTFLFPIRKGRDFIDNLPEPTAKEQHEKIQLKTPELFKKIGRKIHWVFATKFSPFRIVGVGVANTLEIIFGGIGKFLSTFGEAIIWAIIAILALVSVAGIVALFILFTMDILNALLIIGLAILAAIIIMGIGWLVVQSGIPQLTWKMIRASKDKVCPAIRIV